MQRTGLSRHARKQQLPRLIATFTLNVRVRFRRQVLATGIAGVLALSTSSQAAILEQFTFGPDGTVPGVLSPTTVAPNVIGSNISADPGVLLDLTSPAVQPPSSPYLRVTFAATTPTPEAAIAANADFKFTLTALNGFLLNLDSLVFDVMRGGASSPRGYDVRSSVDDYATSLGTADVPTARPEFTNVNLSLTAPAFQNLTTVTFKIFVYSPGTGSSLDFDNITVNGSVVALPFSGYTWKGTSNSNWNTTSPNWSGTGATYVDATPGSDVLFDNTASAFNVTVAENLKPDSITFNNTTPYTFSGSSLEVASSIAKHGTGSVTINNSVSAANIVIGSGSINVNGSGSLTAPNITVSPTGTLNVASTASLGAPTGVNVAGNATFNSATQTVAELGDAGAASGTLTLNGTALTVTGTSSYSGRITGTGQIVKTTGGVLGLGGANDNTGGVVVNGGTVQLNSATAAGPGITVNPGGSVSFAAPVSSPVTLAGGTMGVAAASTVPATVTVTANSNVNTFNPATGIAGADLILTGTLEGTGDLNLTSVNGQNPDGAAFRLRGPTSSGPNAYSGTVTVNQSAKFELQTTAFEGSPMGTGTLVMTGGNTSANAQGTYSIVNLRNNSGGDTTLGNNVRMAGFGYAYFNMLGSSPAGSKTSFNQLEIGDGQVVAAVATGSAEFTLDFASVKLTGGNATFVPQLLGNSSFLSVENINLGPITETVASSGITMAGSATLTLNGTSSYTGPTVVESGTLKVNGSIATSAVTVNTGTISGAGTTGALQLNGGTISPGTGPAVLNTKALTLTAGTLAIEILGSGVGDGFSGHDQVSVVGAVRLDGPIDLALDFFSYDPVDGVDRFTIVANDLADPISFGGPGARLSYQGLLLNEGTPFTASSGGFTQQFRITYAGGTGNDIVLEAIPEPHVGLILGASFVVLSGHRRRRN